MSADPLRSAARWVVVWFVVATFFIAQTLTGSAMRGRPIQPVFDIANEYLYWLAWLIVTPGILWAARRWRFEPGTRRASLLGHGGTAVVLGLVQILIADSFEYALVHATLALPPARLATFHVFLLRNVPTLLMTFLYKYAAVVGIVLAIDYRRRFQGKTVDAARLETDLARAELAGLRAQLHPHFLFNALHSVAMLNRTDPDAAARMTLELSELLRRSLERGVDAEVPLEEELDFVDRYLSLERMRFGDRLRVTLDADESLLGARVPGLALQPLVENAVRHGLGRSVEPVHVEVRARADAGVLVVDVLDDGPGLGPDYQPGTRGTGLANVAARLERLHGKGASVRVAPRSPRGTVATLRVPLRGQAA